MDAFVYGTLTQPEQVAEVVDSYVFLGPAVLEGLRAAAGRYPTLVPPAVDGSRAGDSPASVAGRILRTPDADALDAYEGVDRGLYVRVAVPWADGPPAEFESGERLPPADGDGGPNDEEATSVGAGGSASAPSEGVAVYVGDPTALGVDAAWPGTGPLRERVRRFVDERGVAVRPAE